MEMVKIDRRKKYVLVLDIETANVTENPLAYDIGFAVADKHGHIYEEYSFMIAEMFLESYYSELMDTAYYAEKLPQYWKDYRAGSRKLAKLNTVKWKIAEVMKKYSIVDVYAYNASFDRDGTNGTLRYFTKSAKRFFFPYGTQIHCIQHMAAQTICMQKSYHRFAFNNGLYSESGNVRTSAEAVFKYMINEPEFEEEHKGLEDVRIEVAIMAKCYAQHKPMKTNPSRAAWRVPQKAWKEYLNRIEII